MLSPTQFGLLLPFAFVLETFFGISLPSAKVVDFSVKTSAPSADTAVKPTASAAEAMAKMNFSIMFIPLMFFAAAKRAATFTPTPSPERNSCGSPRFRWGSGDRARSYAVDQGPDLDCWGSRMTATRNAKRVEVVFTKRLCSCRQLAHLTVESSN